MKNKLYTLISKDIKLFEFIENYALFGYLFYEIEHQENFYLNHQLLQRLKKHQIDFSTFNFKVLDNLNQNSEEVVEIELHIQEKKKLLKKAKKLVVYGEGTAYAIVAFHEKTVKISSFENGIKKISIEDQLKISQKAFTSNFENAAIGMAIVSLDGKWENVNSAICTMLGYSKSELHQLTFQDITHPEDLNLDLLSLQKLIKGKVPHYHMEKRYIHKNGSIIYGILAVSMVKNQDKNPLYFISQIVNITKRKNADKKVKSLLETSKNQNERLKNFAHIVSHNLRSHSGNFSMLLDILEEENDEDQKTEITSHLKVVSNNLKETIFHLNEIVIMNNSIYDNLKPIHLLKEVNLILKDYNISAKKAAVNISVSISESIKVLAIKAYLNSILMNFISNGIKYSDPKKESFLRISAQKDKEFVIIEIIDNGLGIDLDKNGDKLFGMYKKFHENEDSKGLGLFIARNQIDALDGKVTVESSVGKGTTFKIYLKHE
ncbi:PAS domain S-box protein [Mesonia sp. MT50]|uniref:histidine kinase n=1 Tax=Mesonia profundi TaxID=3070998 RepID=A0ABU1A6I5_9FLAO|nr:PAS domain S-box protein [Mesonia profundi]MDQ7918566.1 PAS domain S-box protein [Mesonia profundi]